MGSNLITKQTGIDLDEACKILNVKKDSLVLEELNKVWGYPLPTDGSDTSIYLIRMIRRREGVRIYRPKYSGPRNE
jgi:hypothetical protein